MPPHTPSAAVLEKTLDPSSTAEWDQLRQLAHRMLDDAFDYLEGRREQPVWQSPTEEVRRTLAGEALPRAAQSPESVYQEFLTQVQPYMIGNTHPRFWGWVMGGGTTMGVLAEMLLATVNPNVGGFDDAATLVEQQVIRWMAESMGMPATTSGLLMSGCSMANLIGMVVGRHARAGFDVRAEGMQGGGALRIYSSPEVHSWLKKAVELMGMGRNCLRLVPVDASYRIRMDELRNAIAEDRAAGMTPLAVVASAGTVNTGATDDLEAIADLCEEQNLWFHVDGAFGALARWSERLQSQVRGIERADSLAFDLHKWGYMPYDIACVLIRDPELHRAAFATGASYLTAMERGPAAGGLYFSDRNFELSRGFRALKAWMTLKTYGLDGLAGQIEKNVDQCAYLVERIQASPVLELAAEAPLNIVCFRYSGASDEQHQEILMRLQEHGIAVPSGTMLEGRFALRVANSNHRSLREDFDLLIESVERIGREVTGA